jgi:hypothetical protein
MWVMVVPWLCIGMGLVLLDGSIQPRLTTIGHNPGLHSVALLWQRLGAVPGITMFLCAGMLTVPWDGFRTFMRFATLMAAVGLTAQVLKYCVGRARPEVAHDPTQFFRPFRNLFPRHPESL